MSIKIPVVTAADLVFGKIDHLPKYFELPAEYRNETARGCDDASSLFFNGGSLRALGRIPKDGVDAVLATRAIGAILCSFQPKHEHKIAGVGYLIDQWFD